MPKTRLAHVKTLARNSIAACKPLGIVPLATSPKRSMGHLLGGEKIIFLIRDIDGPAMAAAPVESCQDRGPEVSLGSPRVGTRHVQSPTPHARALPASDTSAKMHLKPDVSNTKCQGFGSRALWRAPSTGVSGVGDYPTPDLSQRASGSRSTSEKSK